MSTYTIKLDLSTAQRSVLIRTLRSELDSNLTTARVNMLYSAKVEVEDVADQLREAIALVEILDQLGDLIPAQPENAPARLNPNDIERT